MHDKTCLVAGFNKNHDELSLYEFIIMNDMYHWRLNRLLIFKGLPLVVSE